VTVAKSESLEYSEKVAHMEKAKDEEYCCLRWIGALKDHHAISNNVDSTWAFGVVGRATSDVSIVQFFLVCYVKRALRELATDIAELSILIFGLCLYASISSQEARNYSFVQCVKVCSLRYNLPHRFFFSFLIS
jgi:hypothetical protein